MGIRISLEAVTAGQVLSAFPEVRKLFLFLSDLTTFPHHHSHGLQLQQEHFHGRPDTGRGRWRCRPGAGADAGDLHLDDGRAGLLGQRFRVWMRLGHVSTACPDVTHRMNWMKVKAEIESGLQKSRLLSVLMMICVFVCLLTRCLLSRCLASRDCLDVLLAL